MKNSYPLFVLCALVVTCVLAQDTKREFSHEKLAEFNAYIANEISENKIAGAEVLIIKDKATVWHTASGYKNMKTKAALKEQHLLYPVNDQAHN